LYNDHGRWVRNARLPRRYRSYDLYDGYKVVMRGYQGDTPYEDFREHKKEYARGYRGESQRTIGERPERDHSRFRSKNKGEDKEKGHDERKGKQENN
jgi:hypothetical protein